MATNARGTGGSKAARAQGSKKSRRAHSEAVLSSFSKTNVGQRRPPWRFAVVKSVSNHHLLGVVSGVPI